MRWKCIVFLHLLFTLFLHFLGNVLQIVAFRDKFTTNIHNAVEALDQAYNKLDI
jgi:hypothetical protein